ncbi:unnamed protein product [Parnassius mnemosyne]|uniref:Reverse transcriptase n=1 Tax=Parnassius mnemosyne TaxID=213953 RepID=A0AAV1L8A5_9NEOP
MYMEGKCMQIHACIHAACMRRDLRNFNTAFIEEAIERNQGSKVFVRDLFARKSQLSRLKTECGSIVSGTPDILSEIERFYGQLYTSSLEPHASVSNDPRASLIRHYSEDIPDVSLSEIRMALQHLKNGKSPGEDGITAELLKAGGKPVFEVLQKFFNSVLHGGTTPEAWSRSAVVLFFEKGDNALLKNYRPISLLSRVYVLFSRIITNRLARRLNDFQPPEQAGFRKGYSTYIMITYIHCGRLYRRQKSIISHFALRMWTMRKPLIPSKFGRCCSPLSGAKLTVGISKC